MADGNSVSEPLMRRITTSRGKDSTECTLQVEDCVNLLRETFQSEPRTVWTLIIDAFDECKESKSVLQTLQSLHLASGRLRILVSSRDGYVQDFEAHLSQLSVITIAKQNSEDIRKYVRRVVQERREGTSISDKQVLRLENVFERRAQGM
jgi:hypothetical protein